MDYTMTCLWPAIVNTYTAYRFHAHIRSCLHYKRFWLLCKKICQQPEAISSANNFFHQPKLSQLSPNYKDAVKNTWRPGLQFCQATKIICSLTAILPWAGADPGILDWRGSKLWFRKDCWTFFFSSWENRDDHVFLNLWMPVPVAPKNNYIFWIPLEFSSSLKKIS